MTLRSIRSYTWHHQVPHNEIILQACMQQPLPGARSDLYYTTHILLRMQVLHAAKELNPVGKFLH